MINDEDKKFNDKNNMHPKDCVINNGNNTWIGKDTSMYDDNFIVDQNDELILDDELECKIGLNGLGLVALDGLDGDAWIGLDRIEEIMTRGNQVFE